LIYKIDHLGKVTSSFKLDPQILTEAKLQAVRVHLTVGTIIEEALKEYLKRHRKDKSWEESFRQELQLQE
jgi:hypothetical protein